jgi:hypothetical protein
MILLHTYISTTFFLFFSFFFFCLLLNSGQNLHQSDNQYLHMMQRCFCNHNCCCHKNLEFFFLLLQTAIVEKLDDYDSIGHACIIVFANKESEMTGCHFDHTRTQMELTRSLIHLDKSRAHSEGCHAVFKFSLNTEQANPSSSFSNLNSIRLPLHDGSRSGIRRKFEMVCK